MPNIHQELLIVAPPEKVYNAITTAEGLSGWWTPGSIAIPEKGSIARFPFGPLYHKEMRILELKGPSHVKWRCIAGAEEWIDTTLSFKIHTTGNKTILNSYPEIMGQLQQEKDFEEGVLLIFHHDDWKEYSPMFAECSYTWGQFLRSLKSYCETGKGRPWPNQHTVK
jgi:uncharacterized protein YndB with AHSA1/START domain